MRNITRSLALAAILIFTVTETAFSQSVGLNNATPDASSILDLTATDRGLLVPRMTTTQRTLSITTPATGLLVYDTDLKAFYFYNGIAWAAVGSASADGNGIYDGSGSLVGATVVTQGANTLEFTSTVTDGFSVDGQTFSVDAAKNRVGIGTNSPETTLDVAGIIKSGQDGVDGEIQLYSEQGAPDFLYIISPNAAATQDVSLVLPPDEGNASEFLQTDGSGNLIWAAPAAATNAFATAANVTSNSPGDFTNDDFVFGSPSLDDDTDPNHDNRMLFDKSKGAFRAGGVTSTLWDDANRGNFSFAGGFNNTATGTYSTAFGTISDVDGSNAFGAGDNIDISSAGTAAFGFGWNNTATGIAAGVFGMNASAGGNRSFAMGEYVETTVNNAFALGKGVGNAARISNNITNSMMIGFNSDISTLYIGTASGAGTIGRVGVGTTSPSTTLEVQHNSASTTPLLELEQANATGDASMLIQNTTQAFTLGIDDDDSDKFKISDNTSLGTNDRLTIDGSGNVGIGTASPTTALDVEFALGANAGIDINNADPGTFDPRLRFQIDGTSVWAMGADDSDADKFKIATGGNIGAGAVITIDGSNSFVGIGTTSPATKLDVNGQITMQSGANNGYIPVSDATGAMTWTDPTTITTSDDGDWTISGSDIYSTVAGNVGIGDATPDGKLEVRQTGTDDIFNLYDDAINVFTVEDGGNVGIGISAPEGLMHLRNGVGTQLILGHNNQPTAEWVFDADVSGNFNLISEDFGTPRTVLTASNIGNIGIGTTGPNTLLEIAGSPVGTYGQFAIAGASTGVSATPWMSFVESDGTRIAYMGDGFVTDNNFILGTDQGDIVVASFDDISLIGNGIGVGVADPVNKLDVYGATVIGTSYAGVKTAPANGLLVQGNIGIGNTSPTAPLSFANAAASRKIVMWTGNNNDHQFYGFGVNASTLRYQTDQSDADHVFYSAINATSSLELMRIEGAGNVGIGTSTPNTLFHVAGIATIGNAITPTATEGENILNIISGANANGQSNGIAFMENTSGFGMKIGYDGTGSGASNFIAIYDDSDARIITFENGGNLEVSGHAIATPIVGTWHDINGTSATASEFLQFDQESWNTNTAYFGYASGNNYIEIKVAGYYSISFSALKTSVGANEDASFDIQRYNSADIFQENIYTPYTEGAGMLYAGFSSTIVWFFNADDRLKIFDPNTNNGLLGSARYNALSIYKLN